MTPFDDKRTARPLFSCGITINPWNKRLDQGAQQDEVTVGKYSSTGRNEHPNYQPGTSMLSGSTWLLAQKRVSQKAVIRSLAGHAFLATRPRILHIW